ncbi:hypothetical protein GCM10009785_31080 [Brooklawnia cerclae]|uniref:Acyl transferase domain-containing protein/acyl carrier protein n=1 Tax=Brooklawnia cerclae TaxID=349934 RepID=A0ABX0SIM7_9ACTN|nr:beta-ketoacyl synthase N-terminal-like domain-containing protein [Brooklawnia cerclae]NIH56601.1 acyl transferase domain-containing protein/acyl carrier protein [Brooklawnia cerclae]
MPTFRFRPAQDVAIVGMATRVPGADDYDAFWEALAAGESFVTPLTEDRFASDIVGRNDPHEYDDLRGSLHNAGLDGIDRFDPAFFHITPREARAMDPQQRIVLEESWHCIEDSGIGLAELRRRRTSVFVGATGNDYALLALQQGGRTDPYAPLGNFSCMLANRVSHAFGFSAESVSIDTACSSSLVAVDMACKELRAGTSDYSMVGGVCVTNHPWRFVSFTRAHMMSPDGVCRAFDGEANGFVQGEGVGILLLERLGDALERGHRVLGVVRGSAVNHGGAVANVTAPNPAAQTDVIETALRRAKTEPAAVSYIEAHGTGTSLGDPIEVESLTRAFRDLDPRLGSQWCGIGSLKTNIGHLGPAAGAVGIIKVLLMMRERELVETLNLADENPLIGFGDTPFFPVREAMAWAPTGGQDVLVAGVSGFGFGGVNAHVVLASYPSRPEQEAERPASRGPLPFLLSAHTERSLDDLVATWQRFAGRPRSAPVTPDRVARTLLVGREPLARRRGSFMAPGATLDQALASLRASDLVVEGGIHILLGRVADEDGGASGAEVFGGAAVREITGELTGLRDDPRSSGVVRAYELASILFRGLGGVASIRTGLGQALVALALGGSLSVADMVRAAQDETTWDDIVVGSPRLPLCAPDGSRWITPTVVGADYLVELVEACRAEAAGSELPLRTIDQLYGHQPTYRRLMRDWMRAYDEHAGAQAAEMRQNVTEDDLIGWFAADDDRAMLLRLMHVASETRIRRKWNLREHEGASAAGELAALVNDGHLPAALALGLLAGTAGQQSTDAALAGLDGLTAVRLDERVMPLLARRQTDVGSLSRVLSLLAGTAPADPDAEAGGEGILVLDDGARVLTAPGRPGDLPESLMDLWLAGADVAWADLYDVGAEPVALPVTRFDRQSYWMDPPVLSPPAVPTRSGEFPMLGAAPVARATSVPGESVVSTTISRDTFFVRDHVVGGVPILPGVAYVELALEACALVEGERPGLVRDVSWLRPMRFDEGVPELHVDVRLVPEGEHRYRFAVTSSQGGQDREHARGIVSVGAGEAGPYAGRRLDVSDLPSRAHFSFDRHRVYGEVFGEAIGFDYGPTFQLTRTAYGLGDSTLEDLDTARVLATTSRAFIAHPSVLDASLRAVNWLGSESDCTSLVMQVPFSMDEIVLVGDLNDARYAVATPSARTVESGRVRTHDLDICSESGQVLAHISGFTLRPLSLDDPADAPRIFSRGLAPINLEPSSAEPADLVIVVADGTVEPGLRDLALALARLRTPEGSSPSVVEAAAWLREAHDLAEGARIEIIRCAPGGASPLGASLTGLDLVAEIYDMFKAAAGHRWSVRHTVLSTDRSASLSLVGSLEVFTRSIRFVYPEFTVGVLHLAGEPTRPDLPDEAMLAVLSEAYGALSRVPFLAVSPRGAQAYAFEEVTVDAESVPPCVESGKRYIVSGGSGDIALELVRHYRDRVDAGFLLLGRRAFGELPGDRRTAIEALGPDVTYHQCDVSDLAALEALVATTTQDDRPIAGVLHLAGGVGPRGATTIRRDDLDRVVGAKLVGASNLDVATRPLPLDFFVLFSSLSALVGDSDGSGYALANAGLNAFALQRRRLVDQGERRGVTCSVMWPVWASGALRPTDDQDVLLRRHYGLQELESDEAFAALDAVVGHGVPQCVVLKGDERRFSRIIGRTIPSGEPVVTGSPGDAPSVSQGISDPHQGLGDARVRLTEWLTSLVSGESGIARQAIGAEIPLADYGIDSIMIINLIEKMGERFDDLPSTLFFECQTLHEVADYLERHDPGAVRSFGRDVPGVQEYRTEPQTFGATEAGRSPDETGTDRGDIAIIGYSGRYPQSDDLDEFWGHLLAGDDCIEVVPRERWDHDQYFSADATRTGTVNTKWGGFLTDIAGFDAAFFGISQREGKLMDPQERLFLETVYHAFEHAGYPRGRLEGSDTAVYVGVMNGLYQLLGAEELAAGNVVDARSSYAAIANRVSYVFDFHGPSMAVDTMCSSSLTAIHLACEQLRSGGGSLAVAGGVNVIEHPAKYVFLSEQHFGSTEGKCRAFGDGGDGYVPAEGVGAVILKPLARAVADGDVVHAVIRATGVNHGGRTHGFTVPNPRAQAALVSSALAAARVSARDLGYVEAHGTGTILGDPVEVTGLVNAFTARGFDFGGRGLPIGSVKANIGHAESSAGIASLSKVLLQMKHRTIVPSIHADPVNPRLKIDKTPLRIVRSPEPWDITSHPAALISSFGAGGSNAHLVVSAYEGSPASATDEELPRATTRPPSRLVVLSAPTKDALDDQVGSLAGWIARVTGEAGPGGRRLREHVTGLVNQAVADLIDVDASEIAGDETLFDLGLGAEDFIRLCAGIERAVEQPCVISGTDATTVAEIVSQVITLAGPRCLPAEDAGDHDLPPAGDDISPDADLLERVTRTLQQCREAFEWRVAFIVRSLAELGEALGAYQVGDPRPGTVAGSCDRYRELVHLDDEALVDAATRDDWGTVAASWVGGEDSDWTALYGRDKRFADVPGYVFKKTHLWLDRRTRTGIRALPSARVESRRSSRIEFDTPGDALRFTHVFGAADRVVTDHVIGGRPLVPGAAQLAVVRECLALLDTDLTTFSDVRFLAPVVVGSDVKVAVSFVREHGHANVRIESADGAGAATLHSTMRLDPGDRSTGAGPADSLDPSSPGVRTLGHEEIYQSFETEGIRYGAAFRSLERVVRGTDEASAAVLATGSGDDPELAFVSALDAALQLPSIFVGPLADGSQDAHVPAAVDRVRFGDGEAPATQAHIRRSGPHGFDVVLYGDDGEVVADLAGLRVATLGAAPARSRPGDGTAGTAGETPRCIVPGTERHDGEDPAGSAVSDAVLGRIVAVMSQVLQTPSDQLNPSWTFTDLGVDSVNGFRIVDELNQAYDTDIRSTVLFDYPTADQLRDYLLDLDEVVVSARAGLRDPSGRHQDGDESSGAPDAVGTPAGRETRPVLTAPGGPREFEPIAVVGMSGRFPGARSTDEFWDLLREGRSAVREAPAERWDADAFHTTDPADLSGSVGKWGGFLDGVDRFDPEFFNITGYESRWIDPQQRLMLTEAWHALDDAGYAHDNPYRDRTGVFVGCCPGDYQDLILGSGVALEPQSFWGTSPAVVAARIAYTFDLTGPCASFDTACSSALTACYFACQSLWAGACDMALVGGVFLMLSPKFHLMAGHSGMLSPLGRCASFSEDADGFVPSESVGAVVLKPLSKAQEDKDQILGVIRGIEIGQDGRTNGLTAPNPGAQADLVRSLHERFSVDPSSISYVEAHGTGTQLGDAIEVGALAEAFTGYDAAGRCGLGSAKTNIGHASAAAGIVGLVKILLSLRHRTLPPSLHFGAANPRIGFEDTPFEVVDSGRAWEGPHPLRAGLSSFGFSGTNVHAVIEEAPDQVRTTPPDGAGAPFEFPVSARNAELLRRTVELLVERLEGDPGCSPVDLSYTLSCRRVRFDGARLTFRASTIGDLVAQLRHALTTHGLGVGEQERDLSSATPDARFAGARVVHLPPAPLDERSLWFRQERGLPEGFATVVCTASTATPQPPVRARVPQDGLLSALERLRDGALSLEDMDDVLKGVTNGR